MAKNSLLFLTKSQYFMYVVLPGLRWCLQWLSKGQKFDFIKVLDYIHIHL